MKININQTCTVTLTTHGKNILDNYWLSVKRTLNQERPTFLQCDSEGNYSSELWNIMSIFGKHLYNGGDQLFHENIINIGEDKMLSNYDTYELVKELSTREGVERIEVGVEGTVTIGVWNDINLDVDINEDGPMVILKIID